MVWLNYVKMHGQQNSFILLSDLQNLIDSPNILAKMICSSQIGVGADGLVILTHSKKADYQMVFYNQDGSLSEMCGNAIRCLAKYIVDENLLVNKQGNQKQHPKKNKNSQVSFETLAGIIETTVLSNNEYRALVSVNMGKANFDFLNSNNSKNLNHSINFQNIKFYPVAVGNPHAVTFVDDFKFDYKELAYQLQASSLFPQGVNVEFVKVINDNRLQVRVIERGVGETLACGTGACAVVAQYLTHHPPPNLEEHSYTSVIIELLGGELEIQWSGNKNDPIYMIGPAEKVSVGTYYYSKSNYHEKV